MRKAKTLLAIATVLVVPLLVVGCGKASDTTKVRSVTVAHFNYLGPILVGDVKFSNDRVWAGTTVTPIGPDTRPTGATFGVVLKRTGNTWHVLGNGANGNIKCGTVPRAVLMKLFGYGNVKIGC